MLTETSQMSESRNSLVLRELARDALVLGVDSRIPTVKQYQERLGVGSGTIQRAWQELRRSGAVTLRARGHRGTYIENVNLSRVWAVAERGTIRVIATAPGTVDGYGLVGGIAMDLQRLGLPREFSYLRGSGRRIAAVLNGNADVAVLSAGAYETLSASMNWPLRTLELGPNSYYQPGSLRVLTRAAAPQSDVTRVGIDLSSSDHMAFTRTAFPASAAIEYVDCGFQQIPARLLEGVIDTGVWHEMALLIPLKLVGIDSRPLLTVGGNQVGASISAAVMAYRTEDAVVDSVLKRINPVTIADEQRRISSLDSASDEIQNIIWSR